MMERRLKILVVDDEPQILRVLRRGLETKGYQVVTASDALAAFDILAASRVDMIITDLRMPDVDGIELCTRVRKTMKLPIIVLSVKGEEETKVRALDAGADDYVTKPFGMDELVARIRALSRRATAKDSDLPLRVGDFVVDPELRRVTVEDRVLHLTPKEYELMLFFVSNHGRVLTHRAILRSVWGENNTAQSEYLRVFVAQLRKKIERDPRNPRYILTEPWVGYRFNPQP
jgi:two-component system KDP operon response regulator KdpE